MSKFMSELAALASENFPANADISLEPAPQRAIRVSWKTNDDPERKSKRAQPIIIELHPDFPDEDQLTGHIPNNIRDEFAAFVHHRYAQLKPRTTSDPHQSHVPEKWIFPPDC